MKSPILQYFVRINQHDERLSPGFRLAVRQPLEAPEAEGPATQDHRRLGGYFDYRIDALSEAQLTEYFSDLIGTHSWSAVKLDLYGLKFFTTHVLKQPWAMPNLIKPPKMQRLSDIVTVDEAQRLFLATRVLRYRVFYFTLYSLGLRLGEGLALKVGDIDAARLRAQVRDAKGNRDRLTPAAIGVAPTASTTRTNNGSSASAASRCRLSIFCSPSRYPANCALWLSVTPKLSTPPCSPPPGQRCRPSAATTGNLRAKPGRWRCCTPIRVGLTCTRMSISPCRRRRLIQKRGAGGPRAATSSTTKP